jgi:hypothetical protein
MRGRITKRAIDALRPKERRYLFWDTEVTGFGCKVMPSGKKIYVFQCCTASGRYLDQQRFRKVGTRPVSAPIPETLRTSVS